MGDCEYSIFARIITRALDSDPDLNSNTLSHRLGVSGSTLWGWHQRGRGGGPSLDRLAELFQRMSPAMQDDLLTEIVGSTSIRFYRCESEKTGTCASLAMESQKLGMRVFELIGQQVKPTLASDRQKIRDAILAQRRALDELLCVIEE